MNSEEDEFKRIEREALRRAAFQRKVDNVMRIAFEAAWEDDDTQSYTSEAYRCGFEAGAVAERKAIAQSLDKQADLACDEIDRQWAQEMAAAVRARGEQK